MLFLRGIVLCGCNGSILKDRLHTVQKKLD
nr:MAG TPA: hypothetical protein [Bacteriophage sp.]